MTADPTALLLEHGDEHGCVHMTELYELVQKLELEEEDIEQRGAALLREYDTHRGGAGARRGWTVEIHFGLAGAGCGRCCRVWHRPLAGRPRDLAPLGGTLDPDRHALGGDQVFCIEFSHHSVFSR